LLLPEEKQLTSVPTFSPGTTRLKLCGWWNWGSVFFAPALQRLRFNLADLKTAQLPELLDRCELHLVRFADHPRGAPPKMQRIRRYKRGF